MFAPLGVDNLEFQLNKVLASQGQVPFWVGLRKEILQDIQDWKDERKDDDLQRGAANSRQKVKEINDKILHFNTIAPNFIPRMPTLPKE